MLELVRKIGAEFGIAVLVASHLLGELERVSDNVVILDAGRLLRSSATTDFLDATGTLLVEVLGGGAAHEQLRAALTAVGLTARVISAGIEVEVADDSVYDAVRDRVDDLGLGLVRMQEQHHRIEDVFREGRAGSVQPV
jgi:ABC-2 type transport system ATP-binding protein